MSAANERVRRELGIALIEAERMALKGRPAQRERKSEPRPKDDATRTLLAGVVLQARKS